MGMVVIKLTLILHKTLSVMLGWGIQINMNSLVQILTI